MTSDPPPPPPAPRSRSRGVNLGALYDALQAAPAEVAKARTNSLGTLFVYVPAVTYFRGASDGDPARRANELPRHEVVISAGFYLAARPVTQAEYRAVTGRTPSKFTGDTLPVESVSWDDAGHYCRLLTLHPGETGNVYRLPTEAEWEYACRAGSDAAFGTGDALAADQASFRVAGAGPGGAGPPPVDTFPANAFGLSGMHGGVWEWCADWYAGRYPAGLVRDPGGPGSGALKVLRGGAWDVGATRCRSAYRNALGPHQSDPATGFRVVLVPAG